MTDTSIRERPDLREIAAEDGIVHRRSVFVYEGPIRIWHWITVLAVFVLCITGYLISHPLPSTPGEASDQFLMGYIRFAHFAAGYIFAVAFIGRVYWAFVGNEHARHTFILPFWSGKWWVGITNQILWYLFIARRPRQWVGHNPLSHVFMFLFMHMAVLQIITGFALYSEATGPGTWQHTLFNWVIPLLGSSMMVRMVHVILMWLTIVFILIHVYTAIREDIMSRQSIISTMISGERMFKDDHPDD